MDTRSTVRLAIRKSAFSAEAGKVTAWILAAIFALLALALVLNVVFYQRIVARKNVQVSILQKQVEALNALKAQNSELQNRVEKLTTRIREIEKEKSVVDQEISRLREEVQAAAKTVSALKSENRQFREPLEYGREQIKKLLHGLAIYGPAGTVQNIRWRAEHGDVMGQVMWGVINLLGIKPLGVREDPEKGLDWLDKAATGGNPLVPTALGLYHLLGHEKLGVPQNTAKGIELLNDVASQG